MIPLVSIRNLSPHYLSKTMKKGRPPKLEPRKRINAYIREDLYVRFTLLHFDEDLKKASFGAFSDFINEALSEYLQKHEGRIT